MIKGLYFGFLSLLFISCDGNSSQNASLAHEGYVQGFNIKGETTQCKRAPKDLVCTEIYTPGDAFANACREQGHQVVMCGCHDYLCSKKIQFKINTSAVSDFER